MAAAGLGAFNTHGWQVQRGQAASAGTGAFVAAGTRVHVGAAEWSGLGNMVARLPETGEATMPGLGTLYALGYVPGDAVPRKRLRLRPDGRNLRLERDSPTARLRTV